MAAQSMAIEFDSVAFIRDGDKPQPDFCCVQSDQLTLRVLGEGCVRGGSRGRGFLRAFESTVFRKKGGLEIIIQTNGSSWFLLFSTFKMTPPLLKPLFVSAPMPKPSILAMTCLSLWCCPQRTLSSCHSTTSFRAAACP